jgi:hypothetical protein
MELSTCPLAPCSARFPVLLDLPEPVGGTSSTAIWSGLPVHRGSAILSRCHDDLPAKDHLRRDARIRLP